jgi:muramoyltetrapeptide carboxypeptidase
MEATTTEIVKPTALEPGDTVGLVAPGSPLFEKHRTLIEAREKMHNLGFKTKAGKNIFKKKGYLAGTVGERAQDLHDMFEDDEVQAIIAIRGGYGSGQLLPHLDYELIRKHPKILVGYSDITSLLLGIHAMTGLVTFHGPVAISTFTDYTRKYFMNVLTKSEPVGAVEDAPYESNLQTSNRVWTLREGIAEGRLTGGNLTLIISTLGTPWEIDTKDRILFIEEIGEEPYDLDRMLNHLKQAGKFDHCRGVFFDGLNAIEPSSYRPAFNSTLSVEDIISDVFRDYDFPVCLGISIGHIKDKPTLPIGIAAQLDAGAGRIRITEPAVR